MINLSGLTIKNAENPNGDIEIKLIGLRPGEKLYEELLIGNDPQKTDHPKILKTNEPFIPFEQFEVYLNKLKVMLEENDVIEVKNLIEEFLTSFKSNSKVVDHIYNEKSRIEKHQKNIVKN